MGYMGRLSEKQNILKKDCAVPKWAPYRCI